MSKSGTFRDTFRFDDPGTLHRPGPIGRLVRFAVGVFCALWVWHLILAFPQNSTDSFAVWFWALFGLVLAPYVVNIGFGMNLGSWPRYISAALVLVAGVAGYGLEGRIGSDLLWGVVCGWMIFLYGYLGISFMLAALIATPGCEMRSIPHLFGSFSGGHAREHYCPGFLDAIDRWEHQLDVSADHTAIAGGPESRDMLSSIGRILVVYGIPFVAIQLAGNLGGRAVAWYTPAISFGLVGVICVVNALRCWRVHCIILGPVFLATSVLAFLYVFGVIDFGRDSWSLIFNTALAIAFVVACFGESVFGKYIGERMSDKTD